MEDMASFDIMTAMLKFQESLYKLQCIHEILCEHTFLYIDFQNIKMSFCVSFDTKLLNYRKRNTNDSFSQRLVQFLTKHYRSLKSVE